MLEAIYKIGRAADCVECVQTITHSLSSTLVGIIEIVKAVCQCLPISEGGMAIAGISLDDSQREHIWRKINRKDHWNALAKFVGFECVE